jgi:hypothetical protein
MSANAKFTSPSHGYINGQFVYIEGTINYDGRYEVDVLDEDTFECLDCPYVSNETGGETYPDMDYTFYIAFLFGIEEIFNEIKLKTAIQAKTLRDGNGKLMIEEIAMTEDRRDIFMYFLKEGAGRVFKKIHAYSRGIINSYKFNEQIDLDNSGVIDDSELLYYIHFAIREDLDYQDENMYPMLEAAMKDAIVAYVLKEWYLTTPFAANAQVYETRFNTLMAEITSVVMKAEGLKRVVFTQAPI